MGGACFARHLVKTPLRALCAFVSLRANSYRPGKTKKAETQKLQIQTASTRPAPELLIAKLYDMLPSNTNGGRPPGLFFSHRSQPMKEAA